MKRACVFVIFIFFCMHFFACNVDDNGSVVINEVCSNNRASFSDGFYDSPDWIELRNLTENDINLSGYILTDKNDTFDSQTVLPSIILPGNGYVVIPAGTDQHNSNAFCLPFGISRNGDKLYLENTAGVLVDSVAVPALGVDVSYARKDDGSFGYCLVSTPGKENTSQIYEEIQEMENLNDRSDIKLIINEISVSAIPGTDMLDDWIEIFNPTKEAILLDGMFLSDDEFKKKKAILPSMEILPGDYSVVYCGKRDGQVKISLSSQGESLWLYDQLGRLIDYVQYPAVVAGQTWARNEENGTFGFCGIATPCKKNLQIIGPEAFSESCEGLVISEVLFHNAFSIVDSYGDHSQFIELYNAGKQRVNAAEYYLTDEFDFPMKQQLCEKWIEPGEYYLVFLSGNECRDGECHTHFSVGKDEQGVALYHSLDRCIQFMPYQNDLPDDVSVGFAGGDDVIYYLYPTPGIINSDEVDSLEQFYNAQNTSLMISEVCATEDWIELINKSGEEIDLTGWFLTDDFSKTKRETLTCRLSPGELYVVNPTQFGVSVQGERLFLFDEHEILRDTFLTGDLSGGISSGRISEFGKERFFFLENTKGKNNKSVDACAGRTSQPLFSDVTLFHEEPFLLAIQLLGSGKEIRYTLDGSDPDINSDLYIEPILISDTTTVRARAYCKDLVPSQVITANYVFQRHSLPIICVDCKPAEWQKLTSVIRHEQVEEYEANISVYDGNGMLQVQFPAGIKAHGNASLTYRQKSLSVHLRGRYGQSYITYPFWNKKALPYSSFVLRSGSQDMIKSRMRDSVAQLACESLTVDTLSTMPVVVYVNGSYYGIMDFNEAMNSDYLAAHFNVDSKSVNRITINKTVKDGDSKDFLRVREFAQTQDFSDDRVVEDFSRMVDIDFITDYLVAQTFFGNYDIKNQNYWNTSDGSIKWRPFLYDMDRSLCEGYENYNLIKQYFNVAGVRYGVSGMVNMDLFASLRKNAKWSSHFVERYAEVLCTILTPEKIIEIIDRQEKLLKPEMGRHIELYGTHESVEEWENDVDKLRKQVYLRYEAIQKMVCREFSLTEHEWRDLLAKYQN